MLVRCRQPLGNASSAGTKCLSALFRPCSTSASENATSGSRAPSLENASASLENASSNSPPGNRLEKQSRRKAIKKDFEKFGQRPRGTVDVTGMQCSELAFVEEQGKKVALLNGFAELRTPIFEFTPTFLRSLGQGSDVVRKEMFSFDDKSGNSLTLRPEGTAGAARALLSRREEWAAQGGARAFYHGPMFRYERPQFGRQRQFTQFGVEMMGFAGPSADVQVILIAVEFLQSIGLWDGGNDGARLAVNSLGDAESRASYNQVLEDYFHSIQHLLSKDSRERLRQGRALRILDSKEGQDLEHIEKAPDLESSLSASARERFHEFKHLLSALDIGFEQDPRLVRGLDYYSHTVFEFLLPQAGSGKHSRPLAILAGGRYDGLSETLGFDEQVPAVGWAAGLERLCLERERLGLAQARADQLARQDPKIFVLPLMQQEKTEAAQIRSHAFELAERLRKRGLATQIWHAAVDAESPIKSAIRKGFKQAERAGCSVVAVVGLDEASRGSFAASFKHLDSGKQASDVRDWESLQLFLASL